MRPVPWGESHKLGCGDAAEQREGYRVYIPGAGRGIEDQDLWKGFFFFFFFFFLKESLLCQEKVLGLGDQTPLSDMLQRATKEEFPLQ